MNKIEPHYQLLILMDLQDFFSEYYKVLTALMAFVLGLLSLAMRSYFSEKGKLKAQISENKKLIDQTEKIKAKYQRELEDLKRDHQLDIAKRKYQYEGKKDIYIKFFKLIDEFSTKNNIETQKKFLPILEEFNRNYLQSTSRQNKPAQTRAINVFQKKVQALMFESNEDLVRIKQETNTIRLLASEDVVEKLDLLTYAFEKSMEKSHHTMTNLISLLLLGDQETISKNQKEIERDAAVIDGVKRDTINLMRQELNTI